MKIGSRKPQGRTDQQCAHCRLYYTKQGISGHETHCDLKGKDYHLNPDDVDDASQLPDEDDEFSTVEVDGGARVESVPQFEVVDDDPADVDDPDPPEETLDCPECGSDTGETPDDLEPGEYTCADCHALLVWEGP